ncbi:MAG: hypothetical protein ACUVXJ_15475 [Phycisphaerae bacterium]
MDTFEQEIMNTERIIAGLPEAQAWALERSMRTLTPAQRAYVTKSLRSLETNNTVSPRYLQLLEHFFDKWSSHNLATKLVLINRLTRLSAQDPTGGSLPAGDDQCVFTLPQILQEAS